jgi:ribonuclease E
VVAPKPEVIVAAVTAPVQPEAIAPVIAPVVIPVISEPVVISKAPVAEPVSLVVTAPAAVIHAPAPKPVQPKVELEEVLKAAGLTMAVTNPAKMAAVQQTAVASTAPHAPRQRKVAPQAPDEPLVQIETQR